MTFTTTIKEQTEEFRRPYYHDRQHGPTAKSSRAAATTTATATAAAGTVSVSNSSHTKNNGQDINASDVEGGNFIQMRIVQLIIELVTREAVLIILK